MVGARGPGLGRSVLGVDSMKRVLNLVRSGTRTLALVALSLATLWPNAAAFAQGVTTGALNGIVTNEQQQPIQGANVIAIHLPSGTNYETVTRADGRFTIPGKIGRASCRERGKSA